MKPIQTPLRASPETNRPSDLGRPSNLEGPNIKRAMTLIMKATKTRNLLGMHLVRELTTTEETA